MRDRPILVLDDDEANVQLLTRLLCRVGYTRVTSATDPVAAVDAIERDPPDLLLLDLRMPVLDGHAVLERLRPLLGEPHDLAVLVLTADLTTRSRHRVLAAGARDFLTKPFDVVEVALRVGNLLEIVDLQRRLRDQNAQLEALVAERTAGLVDLAADLAHEVRTPLYAIRGIAEVLLDFEDGLPASIRDDVRQIDDVAVTALDLVDAEIGAARAAAGPEAAVVSSVDVAALLEDLRAVMERTVRAGGDRLLVSLDAGLPPVTTDPAGVGRILRNLVANALQATADGMVGVHARLVDGGERVAFDVVDSGPGVPEADRETIFARYERRDGRGSAGGIGLPIARKIARSLGGDVTVAGPPHEASRFTATVATGAVVAPPDA